MAYTFRTSDLPKLDIDTDKGTDFLAWHQQWLAYRSLSGLSNESAAKQVQALKLCFSRETLTVVDNLGLNDAQKKDQAQTIAALKQHIEGQINETIERRNLRQRHQLAGESVDDFLVSLRDLAKTCNFCNNDCLKRAIRDQIIEGLQDGDTIQELLRAKDLTLDQAISKCRGMEAAKKSRSEIQGTADVCVAQTQRQTTTPATTCYWCGKNQHEGGRKNCPAKGQTCRSCGKLGHFSTVCRRPHPSGKQPAFTPKANALRTSEHGELPIMQLSNTNAGSVTPAPTVQMKVTTCHGQTYTNVLPDSGADICAAGPDLVQALNEDMDNLADSNVTPKAVNGSLLHPAGKLPGVQFQVNGKVTQVDVHIYQSVSGTIISWATAQKLGILPKCYPNPMPSVQTMGTTDPEAHELPTAEQIMSEFPSVFDGQIRTMPGEKFHISLTDDAQPFCVYTPRTIPLAYRGKLKDEIDLLVEQGIIAPVTEPTDWCAPIVVAPKKNSDKIRMCVDLSKLNKYVRRERYPSITPAEAVADIAQTQAKVFTVLDALKGYHQCPLDEESQKLTTFITPFGRFKYMRAPYGISSISEHYNRRMDAALVDMKNFRKIVDDVIIFDNNRHEHIEHVRKLLYCCQEKGISLNREKFKFCQSKVPFAGFILTSDGYTISDEITDAISCFPTPSSRTDLRSFFGLVNQLAASTNSIAEALAPLRPLLSSRNDFLWIPAHDQAFQHAKALLVTAPTLAYFDPKKETHLYTDASTLGVGFVLMQKQQGTDGEWKTVQAGSRFLTDTESRYAVIELECLAIAWAVKKCHIFLSGRDHFTVVTDHNPLVPILNSHRLDEIENPRLQRLRTRLMAYNFTARWVKGAQNYAADALSRHPCHKPGTGDDLAEHDPHSGEAPSLSQIRASNDDPWESENLHLQELRRHANEDPEYQCLKEVIQTGFPNEKNLLSQPMTKFWAMKDHLSIDDDLVVYGCRLFIPTNLRATMLSRLHEAHQGIARSQARARLTIYWPNIDQDIKNFVDGCRHCQDRLPSNAKEPLIMKPTPDRPFQQLAVDFASYGGQQFLIIVDCKTDWPDVIEMKKNTTTPKLIDALRDQFCRTAIPDILWSDEGPQFTSAKLAHFLKDWGVSHKTSSPRYPQSNGKAEATVKSMKKLISAAWTGRSVNWDRLSRSLLQYRNTPSRKDGLSPAQKLLGQPVQDHLPAHRRSFAPEWQQSSSDADQRATSTEQRGQLYYDQHTKELTTLQIGNHVAIQNPTSKMWDIYGTIVALGPHRRYFVKTQSGRVLVRNRRFLRKRNPISVSGGSAQLPPTTPHVVQEPRRSTRTKKIPPYLHSDPMWLSSSSVTPTEELGGEV